MYRGEKRRRVDVYEEKRDGEGESESEREESEKTEEAGTVLRFGKGEGDQF